MVEALEKHLEQEGYEVLFAHKSGGAVGQSFCLCHRASVSLPFVFACSMRVSLDHA